MFLVFFLPDLAKRIDRFFGIFAWLGVRLEFGLFWFSFCCSVRIFLVTHFLQVLLHLQVASAWSWSGQCSSLNTRVAWMAFCFCFCFFPLLYFYFIGVVRLFSYARAALRWLWMIGSYWALNSSHSFTNSISCENFSALSFLLVTF